MKGSISCWWKLLNQLFLLLFPITVAAENGNALVTLLESLLRQQRMDSSIVQTVTLKTPAKLLPDCPSPYLKLASHGRLSGNMSVTALCGERRYFLQIQVLARGDYWVAARTLPAGTSLSAKDIVKKHGELVGQARNVIFAAQPVTGSLTTRTIQAGQPLAATLLRAPWAVRQGNQVAVVSRGPGFQVRHYGKAMRDASVGDTLRVRLTSGQIVIGTVNHQGVVLQNERASSSFSTPDR